MQIRTLSDAPFVVDVLPFRRVADQWQLAVVCKATFDIGEGVETCRPARDPAPVFSDDVLEGASLYAPRDLVPCKARPEIVVVGAAPGSRLTIGERGIDATIEPPRTSGAIAASGPSAKRWHVTQLASEPLGIAFDEEAFQYAPPQLQLEHLPLDRPIVIDDGRGARLTIVLPDRSPVAHLESLETTSRPVLMEPELLWIDVAKRRCTVTWRGVTETELDPAHGLRVGMTEAGKTRWPSMRARTTTASSLQSSYEATHGELPTAVLDSFFDGAPSGSEPVPPPPSSSKTFAGPLPAADHHPAWLAPAGSAATPPVPTEAPTAKRKPRPSGARGDRPSPPPLPSNRSPARSPSAPPRASAPPPPPRPGGRLPPPPRRPSTSPPKGPVRAPAPIWSAEPRAEAAAPIAPNPARALLDERRESSPPPATPERAPKRDAPEVPLRVLDVVWTAETCPEVIDRNPALARSAAEARIDADAPERDPVVGVLREAEPTPIETLASELMASLRERRSVTPVAVVVRGQLELRFDPRTELSVYADAARPLARSDKKLAEAIARIDELLGTPLAAVPDVAHGQRAIVVEQWQRANRDLPRDFLHASARDLLLQQRAFDTRDILGEEHIRATLVGERRHGGEGQQVPVYFPAAAKKRLPLITRMPVRGLVELMPRQDEREAHAVALVAVALGRIVSFGKG